MDVVDLSGMSHGLLVAAGVEAWEELHSDACAVVGRGSQRVKPRRVARSRAMGRAS